MLTFTTPRCIEDVIEQSEHILEEGTFETFMRFMRTHTPAPARKHVGVFTRMRVMQFQNWQLDENVRLRLPDARILAVMRTEFPLNEGQVFTGTIRDGIAIVGGIRADYNRTGHRGTCPRHEGCCRLFATASLRVETAASMSACCELPPSYRVLTVSE